MIYHVEAFYITPEVEVNIYILDQTHGNHIEPIIYSHTNNQNSVDSYLLIPFQNFPIRTNKHTNSPAIHLQHWDNMDPPK